MPRDINTLPLGYNPVLDLWSWIDYRSSQDGKLVFGTQMGPKAIARLIRDGGYTRIELEVDNVNDPYELAEVIDGLDLTLKVELIMNIKMDLYDIEELYSKLGSKVELTYIGEHAN